LLFYLLLYLALLPPTLSCSFTSYFILLFYLLLYLALLPPTLSYYFTPYFILLFYLLLYLALLPPTLSSTCWRLSLFGRSWCTYMFCNVQGAEYSPNRLQTMVLVQVFYIITGHYGNGTSYLPTGNTTSISLVYLWESSPVPRESTPLPRESYTVPS
jgi:hypothetical protein